MAYGLESRVLAVMVDLKGGVAVELQRHLGVPGQGQDAAVAAQVELTLLVLAFGDVDRGVADIEDGGAAAGEHAEPVDELVRHKPVGRGEVRGWRRKDKTVFKVNAVDADGGKQMLII
jgi:hypothetical protein